MYVILFIVIIVAALLTYVLSDNQDDKQIMDGRETKLIDPDSYHPIDPNPVDPWETLLSIPEGMQVAASIIFFIFIVGGAFNIIRSTVAIEAGIRNLVNALGARDPAATGRADCSWS